MSFWIYGLVLDNYELKLCEIFFKNKRNILGYVPINEVDLDRESIKIIKRDLQNIDRYFIVDKNNKIKSKKI